MRCVSFGACVDGRGAKIAAESGQAPRAITVSTNANAKSLVEDEDCILLSLSSLKTILLIRSCAALKPLVFGEAAHTCTSNKQRCASPPGTPYTILDPSAPGRRRRH